MDKLKAFESFVSVATRGSLTAAARAEGVAPAIMGRRLDALEEHLGVKLLVRTTRRISLTHEGSAFLEDCQRLMADVANAEASVSAGGVKATGHLRITAPAGFGRRHVAPLVPRFRDLHPEVTISLNLSDRVVDMAGEGFDCAVRVGDLPDSSLVSVRIADNRRLCVATPAYLARRGVPLHPNQLAQHDCLTLSSDASQTRGWAFRLPRQEGGGGPQEVVHFDRQAGGQQVEDLVGVGEAETAGHPQGFQGRRPAQNAGPVAVQLAQEIAQGLVVGHQHTVTPARRTRVEDLGGLDAPSAQCGPLPPLQNLSLMRTCLQLHRTRQHREPAAIALLMHADLSSRKRRPALAGLDNEWRAASDTQGHFAPQQGQATPTGVEVQRGIGIDVQHAAIGQGQPLPLTHTGCQIGAPGIDRQFTADQPGRRCQRGEPQHAFEQAPPALVRTVEAGHRQLGRQCAKARTQGLDLLPGMLVTGVHVTPALQRQVVLLVGRTGLDQRQPTCRRARHPPGVFADFAVQHSSTSRQCS